MSTFVVQSWINSFSTWMTLNWSHVMNLIVFIEAIFKSISVGPSFQTCFPNTKGPIIDGLLESLAAFFHQRLPRNCSISYTIFWWLFQYFYHSPWKFEWFIWGISHTRDMLPVFSIGINTGASGRTFAEIVCLYGTKFSVILSYWNCFEWDFFDRNSFSKNIFRLGHHGLLMQAILPGQFGRAGGAAFFELEQDRCLYPWEVSETAAQLENLIPNFSKEVTLPLILLLVAHPLPISRGQDASFQEAVFANMYCLQFAEISVTYLTSPRLMTTQDFDPSPLTASSDL